MFIIKTKDIRVFLKSKCILIVKKYLKIEVFEIQRGGHLLPLLAKATYVITKVTGDCQPHLALIWERNLLTC